MQSKFCFGNVMLLTFIFLEISSSASFNIPVNKEKKQSLILLTTINKCTIPSVVFTGGLHWSWQLIIR